MRVSSSNIHILVISLFKHIPIYLKQKASLMLAPFIYPIIIYAESIVFAARIASLTRSGLTPPFAQRFSKQDSNERIG